MTESESDTEEAASGGSNLLAEAAQHPVATTGLVLCVVLGAVLCAVYLPEDIAAPRRIIGGALLGGLSWLLIMVGRVVGG